MKKTRIGRSILTLMLALVMVFELIPMSLLTAFANDPSAQSVVYPGGTQGIADFDTSTKYTLSLGDNASTEHAGRIWTDKSVYAGSASFETYGGGTLTYRVNENGIVGEDFLVAYSALATSESVEGQTQAPVDVVLILDVSGSMSNEDSNMDNGYSRIYNTVQAANNAISELMALNEYTRVAVVTFSTTASVLLPLDRYEQEVTVERQWVQTGNYGWQGYWSDVEVVLPYFSLSRNTGSDNYATLYTNAVNSAGEVIEKSISVEGGTNIQAGLYTGMNVLATEQSTKANINGAMIQRVPSVILLSDGSPTYSSSSNTWWAPSNNGSDGPGNGAYAGNGMKAIMTGAYMKKAVDRNYGVAGTNYGTTVYTVGMGISELRGDEGDLAYMTLNPGAQWNTTDDNDMRDTIKDYWADYTANNNTGTARVNVGRRDNNRYYDDWYTLTHPSVHDVDPANGYDYVDNYYDADNAGAVLTVFDQIVSSISISAPQIPTEIKGYDPISDGYITYTDPIGKYMEVKDVRAIIYAGTEFKNKTVVTNGNETTYTFSGSVHSPVYGDQEITSIIIKVTKAGDGSETMTVMIPASVIPLRVNYVTLNADGSVKTHTNNGAYPARVIYSVGMQDEIVKLDDNGGVYIDTTKVDPSYISANKNEDGSVNFYSNLFTGTNTVNGYSAGNATVEFEPSHSNRYYYILEDMPIYKDAAFKNQVTASEGLDDNTTYYYRDDHYHGNSVEITAVPRTGAQLKKTTIVTGADGFLYRAAGSPRTNKILEFEGTKVANATKTAEDFYAPTFEYAVGSTDPFEGKYVIYHGNNGVISLAMGGNLAISKTVEAGVGLTAPDASFDLLLILTARTLTRAATTT